MLYILLLKRRWEFHRNIYEKFLKSVVMGVTCQWYLIAFSNVIPGEALLLEAQIWSRGIVKMWDHLKAEKLLTYEYAHILWKSLWKTIDQLQKYCWKHFWNCFEYIVLDIFSWFQNVLWACIWFWRNAKDLSEPSPVNKEGASWVTEKPKHYW